MSFSISYTVDKGESTGPDYETMLDTVKAQNPDADTLFELGLSMVMQAAMNCDLAFGDPEGTYHVVISGHHGETSRSLNVGIYHEGPLSEFKKDAASTPMERVAEVEQEILSLLQ